MAHDVISVPRLLTLLLARDRTPAGPPCGPEGEPFDARALRWLADRRSLAGMDAHLLADLGLTRADLAGDALFVPHQPRRPRGVSWQETGRPCQVAA